MEKSPSLALGTYESNIIEMTGAYSFLANKFFKKNSGRFVSYANINGKILLIIDYGKTYICEIISFNENADIMIEYLIECNKLSNDTAINKDSIFENEFEEKILNVYQSHEGGLTGKGFIDFF